MEDRRTVAPDVFNYSENVYDSYDTHPINRLEKTSNDLRLEN
jgi:hypothetical protein